MTPLDATLRFGPFLLHPSQGLRLGEREVRVTPKSLAVLTLLAQRAGQIVTKEELFGHVWPNSLVTDASLTTCIRELRRALRDDARHPQYIETVHRRGYRLMVRCTAERLSELPDLPENDRSAPICGRTAELQALQTIARRAAQGSGETVLLTGPEGIGKTTLARALLADLSDHGWRVVHASCRRPGSTVTAYAPVLDLLAALCSGPEGRRTQASLQRDAPTWLAELAEDAAAEFVPPAAARALQQRTSGATTGRRRRELSEALVEVAAEAPLAICFDDLDAADSATLEWLSEFTRSRPNASVLVLATITGDGNEQSGPAGEPIRSLRGSSTIVEVPPFDPAAVSECIAARLAGSAEHPEVVADLARQLFSRTAGLPLFVSGLLDLLVEQGTISDAVSSSRSLGFQHLNLPDDLDGLCERRLDRLSARKRQVLLAASVVGDAFSVNAIAAAADLPATEVESTLQELGEAGFFSRTAPHLATDGTPRPPVALAEPRLGAALYTRLSAGQRSLIHGRIGRYLERTSEGWRSHQAAALADHYERAGEFSRAIWFLNDAGATARRLGATSVALAAFRHAHALLGRLPPSSERDTWDADLSVSIGRELVMTEGLNSPPANESYARALDLQRHLVPSPRLGRALWGMWVFYINHGPLSTAHEVAERLLVIAQERSDPALLLEAHHALWGTSMLRGDMRAVLAHTREGMLICSSKTDGSLAMTTGCTLHDVHLGDHHAAVCAGFFGAWADAADGRKETAVASLNAAISHARDIQHPFTLAMTLVVAAGVLATADDAAMTRVRAAEGRSIAADQGFGPLEAWASIYEGWALTRLGNADEGLPMVRSGLDVGRAIGTTLFRPFQLALAADAELYAGLPANAAQHLEEGVEIAERVGDGLATAELHRLEGELLLRSTGEGSSRSAVEARFVTARKIAEAQGARLLAQRADAGLARLRQNPPR